jgi:DNA-binding ferritin-like protein
MSIFTVAAQLQSREVVAADSDTAYALEWLKILGTVVDMTQIAQRFHWNVRGRNFGDTHAYFNDLYDFSFKLEDLVGEKIRQIDIDFEIPGKDKVSGYSLITKTYNEYRKHGSNFKSKYNAYFAYTIQILRLVINTLKDLNKLAVEQEDLGGQNLITGQIQELDVLLWKAKAFVKSGQQV